MLGSIRYSNTSCHQRSTLSTAYAKELAEDRVTEVSRRPARVCVIRASNGLFRAEVVESSQLSNLKEYRYTHILVSPSYFPWYLDYTNMSGLLHFGAQSAQMHE